MKHSIASKVYEIVKQIPGGKVTTYGAIAKQVGTSPRVVGKVLHLNPNPKNIPCYRVVNRNGKAATGYAFGGARVQRKKLLAEGVGFRDNWHVYLAKHLWKMI